MTPPLPTREEKKVCHVNPECLDSRFCNPHSELGGVTYDYKSMIQYIIKLEQYVFSLPIKEEKK